MAKSRKSPPKKEPEDKNIFLEMKEYFQEIPEESSSKSKKKSKNNDEIMTKDKIFKNLFENPSILLMFLKDYVKEDWVKDLEIKNIIILRKDLPLFFKKIENLILFFALKMKNIAFILFFF